MGRRVGRGRSRRCADIGIILIVVFSSDVYIPLYFEKKYASLDRKV